MSHLVYLHMLPEGALPELSELSPFRAVVMIECHVTPDWQAAVSNWLVRSGCLYMMAWGIGCSSWDDSVDMANIERFEFKEIPDAGFVVTTWHENEPLEEVFWFSKHNAFHADVELTNTLLLHISPKSREQELLKLYVEA